MIKFDVDVRESQQKLWIARNVYTYVTTGEEITLKGLWLQEKYTTDHVFELRREI